MTAPEGGGLLRRVGRPYVDAFGHTSRRRVLYLHSAIIALALLGALSSWIIVLSTSTARASSITTLKQKAQAIATEIANDNARLSSLSTTYIDEHAAYVAAGVRAALTKQRIHKDEQLIARDRLRVQHAVVAAYVSDNNDDASPLAAWSSNPNTEISTTTYLGVATDQLGNVVAQFQGDQHTLNASLIEEQRSLSAAATALTSTTSARGSVLLTVETEHQLYTSTNAQLNVLVAAAAARAEAAQERAQAAATAAAAAAASAATVATSTSANTTPAGPPSPSGLATVGPAPTPPSNLPAAFAAIRNCESSDDYTLNTGNGYYGAYQFALSTWLDLGESGLPSTAPPATQDAAALLLYQRAGDSFAAWPTCAAIAGLG